MVERAPNASLTRRAVARARQGITAPNNTACSRVLNTWCSTKAHCAQAGAPEGPATPSLVGEMGYGHPLSPGSHSSTPLWRCYVRQNPDRYCMRHNELRLLHSEASECRANISKSKSSGGSALSDSGACGRALNGWCTHRSGCAIKKGPLVARLDFGHPRQPNSDRLQWRCYARPAMRRGRYQRENASRDGVGDYCTRDAELAVLRDGLPECSRSPRYLMPRAERQHMLERRDDERTVHEHALMMNSADGRPLPPCRATTLTKPSLRPLALG